MRALSIICLLFTFSAYAKKNQNQNQTLDQAKERILKSLELRITTLKEQVKCVEGAKAKAEIKECRKHAKQALIKYQKENRAQRNTGHGKKGKGKGKNAE